jgi:hypothetical protein
MRTSSSITDALGTISYSNRSWRPRAGGISLLIRGLTTQCRQANMRDSWSGTFRSTRGTEILPAAEIRPAGGTLRSEAGACRSFEVSDFEGELFGKPPSVGTGPLNLSSRWT